MVGERADIVYPVQAAGTAVSPRSERLSAYDTWMKLLQERRDEVSESIPSFRQAMVDAGVSFGGRPLCNHVRPKFLTADEAAKLRLAAEAVMTGIMAAKDRMLADPELLDTLGLTDLEREMVAVDPGFSHVSPCARLDAFITPEGPRFVELNGECPAGPGYGDRLADVFRAHSLTQAFEEIEPIRYESTLPPLLDTLLTCWNEFDGSRSPTVAIVDYEWVPTANEFVICRDYFQEKGVETFICDPRNLEYAKGRLTCDGRAIDLVYKRVLMNEFIERIDEVRAMWDAYRDGAVCVVNPLRSKLVHKKAIFDVLTSDDRDEWLSSETAALIDEAVPWTRRVSSRSTRYAGEVVDLIPFLEQERERFVLKPNDDYGGKGITLGWEVSEAEWKSALAGAVQADYVVQERVTLIAESFPRMDDFVDQDLFVDLDPYLYLGRMHGALARLGAGSLCNVSSGGGQVPLFITIQ